jgi:hypothetical protein
MPGFDDLPPIVAESVVDWPPDEEIAAEAFSEAFRTVFFDERPRDDVGCGSADCRHDHAALAALGRVCPARAARTLGVRP